MVAQKQKELSKCHEQKCQKEMCYVCTQRAERNIPVYTRKLEEEEDKKMAKILLDAEQKLAVEQEQRKVNTEYSSYNFEEAQYVNEKRKIENSHPLPHASYVMKERPLTPHKSVGHRLVAGELIGQMNMKESRKSKTQKDKKLIEKVYQLQLAEEIAREREEFWREKQENKNKLHATYQYQMATREPQLPRAYSAGKVFGKHDLNKEKLAKIKERNKTYATENSNIHHRHLTARKSSVDRNREVEIMMLKRTKTDLENDTLRRDKHKVSIRRDLESNWVDLHRAKRDREFDEKVGIPEKITVSEQLDHYRRCGQCKRAPNQRTGQTNIWKESYYTPGSRIVV
ncbi:unnamed protein product [Oikopleura dioica]|uniref:Uncharacterized protein n=1 Tax=Oikopleura dioica TaxID=34765 RepID=E4XXE4_OIKDI|nr:unnamed protein product [Oikopleura dioica]